LFCLTVSYPKEDRYRLQVVIENVKRISIVL